MRRIVLMMLASENVKNRVWGVGHHWYSGDHFDGMRLVHEQFGKVLISDTVDIIHRTGDVQKSHFYNHLFFPPT